MVAPGRISDFVTVSTSHLGPAPHVIKQGVQDPIHCIDIWSPGFHVDGADGHGIG
jgi:hypothetical protein